MDTSVNTVEQSTMENVTNPAESVKIEDILVYAKLMEEMAAMPKEEIITTPKDSFK